MSYNRNEKHRRNRNRNWKNDNRQRQEPKIDTRGKSPSHVTVVVKKGEHPERAIKRFLKKCKKLRIVEEYRKRQYFEKPSAKRRRERLKREETIRKEASKDK
jgi:small subunit ribosomal protein S21